MYIVTVRFTVLAGEVERFIALMGENARLSVSLEPGCRQFQLSRTPEAPREFFVYEAYDDLAAFQAHAATEHVQRIAPALGPLIEAKDVRKYTSVEA